VEARILRGDLKTLYDRGSEYEQKYGNCAQCTLATLFDFFEIEDEKLFKAATALSGGTASMGNGNCGAYSGGVLALGLLYGRERKDFSDREKTERAKELAGKLHARFMEQYGGVTCHDVQRKVFGRAFNLRDPKDYEAFEKAGAHLDKCPSVVGNAVRWTGEIILAEKGKTQT